jgi:hypothetical protein
MKTRLHYLAIVLALLAGNHQAAAQGTTAFTYQGQLHDGGTNANGAYTMIFKLYNASTSGTQVGSTITTSPMLANGLFSVNLDFGNVFNGSAYWLDITVTNGGGTQTLSPRVQLLPAPYALYAAVAATVTNGSIMNAQLATNAIATTNIQNGAITTAQIANGAVTNSNLAANAVATANIIDLAVTDAKIVSVSGGKIIGTVASATNAALLNGLSSANFAQLTNNPIFTGGLSLQQGAAGPTVWNVNVGNGTAPSGQTFGNCLIFSANGVPCFDVVNVSGNGPVAFTPNQLGAAEVDCGQMNVRNGSWNSVTHIDSSGNITTSGYMNVGGNVNAASFSTTSDRNLKEKFAPIDNQEILKRVASLPISRWNFKTDAATRHIGPMAQDFYAAFNVGMDDRHIATVDEDGVALAAIQGLNEKLKEEGAQKDAQIKALEKRLSDLEQLVKTFGQK